MANQEPMTSKEHDIPRPTRAATSSRLQTQDRINRFARAISLAAAGAGIASFGHRHASAAEVNQALNQQDAARVQELPPDQWQTPEPPPLNPSAHQGGEGNPQPPEPVPPLDDETDGNPERLSVAELEALINQDPFLSAQGPVSINHDYGLYLTAVTEQFRIAHPNWKNLILPQQWAQNIYKATLLASAIYGDETTAENVNYCMDRYEECLYSLRNNQASRPNMRLFTQDQIKEIDGENNPSYSVPLIDVLEGRIPIIFLSGADGPIWEWGDGERLIDHYKTNNVSNSSALTIALTRDGQTAAIICAYDADPIDWGFVLEQTPVSSSVGEYGHQLFSVLRLSRLSVTNQVELQNGVVVDVVWKYMPLDIQEAISKEQE